MNHKPRTLPRSPRAVQRLSTRDLAELTAVAEADLFATLRPAEHTDQLLRQQVGRLKRTLAALKRVEWCYTDLIRRSEAGLLAEEGAP